MRKIGSPLNLTGRIKRGWIQQASEESEDDDGNRSYKAPTGGFKRVNFLYNPSSAELRHEIDPSVRNPEQAAKDDVMDQDTPTIGSSVNIKLLYDRTYELFSAPREGRAGFANRYGVFADVAAWYTYMGMLEEMPTSWQNGMITRAPMLTLSYLFIGSRMVYYGWPASIGVTYSHWTQEMIPARCAVDIGFHLLPHTRSAPLRGVAPVQITPDFLGGWTWEPDGSFSSTPREENNEFLAMVDEMRENGKREGLIP